MSYPPYQRVATLLYAALLRWELWPPVRYAQWSIVKSWPGCIYVYTYVYGKLCIKLFIVVLVNWAYTIKAWWSCMRYVQHVPNSPRHYNSIVPQCLFFIHLYGSFFPLCLVCSVLQWQAVSGRRSYWPVWTLIAWTRSNLIKLQEENHMMKPCFVYMSSLYILAEKPAFPHLRPLTVFLVKLFPR